jgi:hypothetical protein
VSDGVGVLDAHPATSELIATSLGELIHLANSEKTIGALPADTTALETCYASR